MKPYTLAEQGKSYFIEEETDAKMLHYEAIEPADSVTDTRV